MATMKTRSKGEGSLYQDAKGRWVFAFEDPTGASTGKRRRIFVRAQHKYDAVRKARKRRQELEQQAAEREKSPRLNDWVEIWYNLPRATKPSTMRGYRNELRKRILPLLGHYRLDELEPAHMVQLAEVYATQGLSGTTARLGHVVIHKVLGDAMLAGRVDRNVAAKELSLRPAKSTKRTPPPRAADVVRVLEVAARDQRLRGRWLAAFMLGLRKSEALGLMAEDVDPVAGTVRVDRQLQRLLPMHGCPGGDSCGAAQPWKCPQVQWDMPASESAVCVQSSLWLLSPKTEASRRTLPLVGAVGRALVERAGVVGSGLLWSEGGVVWTPEADHRAWGALLDEAGVSMTLHDARKAAASLLMSAQVPSRVAMDILGHSSLSMTLHYQHSDVEQMAVALGSVGDLLGQ